MPGVIHLPNRPLKRRLLSDCISIASFEQGFVINKDGSLAVGFEATLFEEESLNPDHFRSIITELSTATRNLPTGTVVQKLDIYW